MEVIIVLNVNVGENGVELGKTMIYSTDNSEEAEAFFIECAKEVKQEASIEELNTDLENGYCENLDIGLSTFIYWQTVKGKA